MFCRMFAGRDNAPENLDQEVPRRFKELIRNTKQAAELKKKSRKQKREIIRNMSKKKVSYTSKTLFKCLRCFMDAMTLICLYFSPHHKILSYAVLLLNANVIFHTEIAAN